MTGSKYRQKAEETRECFRETGLSLNDFKNTKLAYLQHDIRHCVTAMLILYRTAAMRGLFTFKAQRLPSPKAERIVKAAGKD
jgi:hypothetical protein